WTDLANAVKKCVVVLTWKVATQSAVRERDVLAAEVSCRSQKNSGRDDTGDERERAGRIFLVQRALRIEHQQPLHEIRGDVGFQSIDGRQSAEHGKHRDESRA